jgi:hypothetical protein
MIQLIDQPYDGQLGTVLKEKLSDDKYKHFIIVSAFAKNSGVLRMKESLQNFRNCGGKVEAFIGLAVSQKAAEKEPAIKQTGIILSLVLSYSLMLILQILLMKKR